MGSAFNIPHPLLNESQNVHCSYSHKGIVKKVLETEKRFILLRIDGGREIFTKKTLVRK